MAERAGPIPGGGVFLWAGALLRLLLEKGGLGVAWTGRRAPCGRGMRARHPTAAFTFASRAPAQHRANRVSHQIFCDKIYVMIFRSLRS